VPGGEFHNDLYERLMADAELSGRLDRGRRHVVSAHLTVAEKSAEMVRVLGADHFDSLNARSYLAQCCGAVSDVAGEVEEYGQSLIDTASVRVTTIPKPWLSAQAWPAIGTAARALADLGGEVWSFELLVVDRVELRRS
jgi:hypothetical protein